MSHASQPPRKMPFHRLLIGFDHCVECRTVLSFAAKVAEAAEVELAGVFVEDQELLDLARFPFSTEILSASGAVRNFEARRVESDLRAIAAGMHEALRKLAGQARRQYSFRTVRGHLLRNLIAMAGADDLILLRTPAYPWRGNMPKRPSPGGPVILLQPPGLANGNLRNFAQEIAKAMKVDVSIQENYTGPDSLPGLNASLLIAPASLFSGGDELDRFVSVSPAPVLIVPANQAPSPPRR